MKNKAFLILISAISIITVASIFAQSKVSRPQKMEVIDISSLHEAKTVNVAELKCIEVKPIVDKKPYDVPMDLDMQWFVQDVCMTYNVDEKLVFAIIEKESAYNEDAKCGKCVGLMQVSTKWHKERMEKLGLDNMIDPQENIYVGVDYLAELFSKYHDENRVLMAYNMGESGAKKYWNKDIYSTKYVKAVQQIKKGLVEQ